MAEELSNPEQLKEAGLAAFRQGDYGRAETLFETAVTRFAAAGDSGGQGEMLNNLGIIYRLNRQHDKAIKALTEAEQLFAALPDANRQGQCVGNLADVYLAMGKKDEAAKAYSRAASLFAQANEPEKQAMVLRALSLLKVRQGHWLEAMARMWESLQVRPSPTLLQRLFARLLKFALSLMGYQAINP
jgi:tetratricopeptide (TPR) repeat protein